jgi:hypothetical protein
MILFCILLIWFLIGYGILRLQRIDEGLRLQGGLGLEVENKECPERPVRWYYYFPWYGFHILVLCVLGVAAIYLAQNLFFDYLFTSGLELYAEQILDLSDGLCVAPLLRIIYYLTVILFLSFIFCIAGYFLSSIIRNSCPIYYAFSLKRFKKGNKDCSPITTKQLALILIVMLIAIYCKFSSYLMLILAVCPVIFSFYVIRRVMIFLGIDSEAGLFESKLLKSAFRNWMILALVVCLGLCFAPIYVLGDNTIIVSVLFGTKEIKWSEIVDLKLKIDSSSLGVSSGSSFYKDRYPVTAIAISKSDYDLKLFSIENKDVLDRIVRIFRIKGIPVNCSVDPSVNTKLGEIDSAPLKFEERRTELLSYINETCKK